MDVLEGEESVDLTEDQWSDIAKSLVETAAGQIPYVGGMISSLVDYIWPAKKETLWDQIKDQVENMIDQKILAFELQERQGEISGLKDSLKQYRDAKLHEKGAILSSILAQLNTLHEKLTGSVNKHQLIPLTVVTSIIHMSVLRERLEHGKQIYEEDNTPIWRAELLEMYDVYIAFFREIYPQWKSWRDKKITTKTWTTGSVGALKTAHGLVTDGLIDNKMEYYHDGTSDEDYFGPLVAARKQLLLSQANAEMAATLAVTFLLNVFKPGGDKEPPDVDPALESFHIGPYSVTTLGVQRDACRLFAPTIKDKDARIEKLLVREYNSIDGIRIYYQGGRKGTFIGHNQKGGEAHTLVPESGSRIIGWNMMFTNGILCEIEVVYSNKTSSGWLGNRRKWKGHKGYAVGHAGYEMVGGSFDIAYGPDDTSGPALVELHFTYASKLKA